MRIDTITSLEETMLGIGLIVLVLVAGAWLALSHRPHHYGGHYGIPGGLEGWQHGSYRWRRGMEAAALIAIIVIAVRSAIEIAVSAGLMALGLLVLAWWTVPRRRRSRLDVLACWWPSSLGGGGKASHRTPIAEADPRGGLSARP